MPLIEGIGDEVLQTALITLLILVISIAWWSTNSRPNNRYRTMVVVRTRTHPVTVAISSNSPNVSAFSYRENVISPLRAALQHQRTGEATPESSPEGSGPEGSPPPRVIPLQEMDSIVDADMAMVNHHRLHFYRRVIAPAAAAAATEPPGAEQMREMDSIVSAMEAGAPAEPVGATAEASEALAEETKLESKEEDSSDPPSEEAAPSPAPPGEDRILIKLKYLNDTFREVEGSLDEMLKDFKWRHFSAELSAARRVRLIYRGRVLEDAATLRAAGLHHGAVVHALLAAARPPQAAPPAERPAEAAEERTWDLENILMTLVSVALTVVWFFRCEYSSMFTTSASAALFGLTLFYTVAICGVYLTDTFHLDRRPAAVH